MMSTQADLVQSDDSEASAGEKEDRWFDSIPRQPAMVDEEFLQYSSDESQMEEESGEECSLFFSDPDEADNAFIESGDLVEEYSKTASLGAEVARARQQLNQMYVKVEECERGVKDGRSDVSQCRERQAALRKEVKLAQAEIDAASTNVPNAQRLKNLKARLERELIAEMDLEKSLDEFVHSQEVTLNKVLHDEGRFQQMELTLTQKEDHLHNLKSVLVDNRKQREESILYNAERKAIGKELNESLVNLEFEDRTKTAIAAARQAQRDGQRFLKDTWRRVKEREQREQEEKRAESEKRVRMLLQYKTNLQKTQAKLKKNSERKERQTQEKESQKRGISAEERYKTAQKQKIVQREMEFEATQHVEKSALINKILAENDAIDKRMLQQPQLFRDRLMGRHNKPMPRNYRQVRALAKHKQNKEDDPSSKNIISNTVGYSSSEEELESNETDLDPNTAVVGEQEEILVEPEFRGLWEMNAEAKPSVPVRYSKLEQCRMKEALQRQRENIVQPQITVQREFKGQAFTSKPERVVFNDYEVGEVYNQNLTLTNVSYTINTLKMIGLSTNLLDFITVDFIPPGHLSAGLTCDLKVTFAPLINKDISGEIKMLAQTGPFSIPVSCMVKRTAVSVPNQVIDFGTVCVGEHQKAYIEIKNSGALGTHYKVQSLGWGDETPITSMEKDSVKELSFDNLEPVEMELESEVKCKQQLDQQSTVTFATLKDTITLPATPFSAQETKDTSIVKIDEKNKGDAQEEFAEDVPAVQPADKGLPTGDITLNSSTARGFIAPFSSTFVEVLYNPRQVCHHTASFLVVTADGNMEPVKVTITASTIDLPVYVGSNEIHLKYCMLNRLYQDSVVLYNTATSALRIKFEIPSPLRDHLDILPQNGVIQANSSFSAQLKFIPLPSIFDECQDFFSEGQLLNVPIRVKVADQTRCVPFTVSANVSGTDISFSTNELNFGCCSIYESVQLPFSVTNHCLLPQMFGFVSVPEFVTIQPNDGFGTLLPGETLELQAVVHMKLLGEQKFSVTCTTEIGRHFSLTCTATGVIPHLEVSHPLFRFAPTALGDVRRASFYISNNAPKTDANQDKSFHIVVPSGVDLTVSPSIGTVSPGHRVRLQMTFGPTLRTKEVEEEAMNKARRVALEELEKKKRDELETERNVSESQATSKKGKGKKGSSKPITPKLPNDTPASNQLDSIEITEDDKIAAMIRLKTSFHERFDKVLLPCFTAHGVCSHTEPLSWNCEDTVYLQVHLPAVKPEIVLLSHMGSPIVDFGRVSLGQSKKVELTLKSICDYPINLSTSPFPHDGTFQKINATRNLEPHGLHPMLLEFSPKHQAKYYEVVEIKTNRSTLHLHLHGTGVVPSLSITPDSLMLGHAMVGDTLSGTFTITNSSEIRLQYSSKLSGEQRDTVQSITGSSDFGNNNASGVLPFHCLPHSGAIEPGQSQEITVIFTPDHADSYRDIVIVKLLDQPQETRIPVSARSWQGSMFVLGARLPSPNVTVHTVNQPGETSTEGDEITDDLWVFFPPTMLGVTTTETLSIGNCRTIKGDNKGAKPTGDFVVEPLKADYGPLTKALVVNPPKGAVDPGALVKVVFQFTPPKETTGDQIQFSTILTLKGETIEQYRVKFVAQILNAV